MNSIEVDDYIYDNLSEDDKLRGYTIEGKWKQVEDLYKSGRKFSTIEIHQSRGTALHVAVNDNNVKVVRNLVDSIISHRNEKALECKNENGDTPLHLAASRGFKDICESIIGKDGERKELIDIDNNAGETPLFLAALSWQKQTLVYLFNFKPRDCDRYVHGSYFYYKYLIRNNGDSILHCALKREFFDLALIIIDKFPNLISIPNKHGVSPLKLLATRPSGFESGCKMTWWKRILYHCIPVRILNVKEAVKYYAMKQESSPPHNCPENYDTCYLFLQKCKTYAYSLIRLPTKLKGLLMKETTSTTEYGSNHMREKPKHKLLPEMCLSFMKFALIYILGLSGVGVEEIQKMKQKHKWSGQLLNKFMEKPYESYSVTGTKPIYYASGADFMAAYKPNQGDNNSGEPKIYTHESETTILRKAITDLMDELTTKIPKISVTFERKNDSEEPEFFTLERQEAIYKTLESETAILTAARNGIVEIVNALITEIPSSIYDVNLENKNVLLVAVENRRTNVVEALRKQYKEFKTKTIFDNLIQGVDNEENTVLHLLKLLFLTLQLA